MAFLPLNHKVNYRFSFYGTNLKLKENKLYIFLFTWLWENRAALERTPLLL